MCLAWGALSSLASVFKIICMLRNWSYYSGHLLCQEEFGEKAQHFSPCAVKSEFGLSQNLEGVFVCSFGSCQHIGQ